MPLTDDPWLPAPDDDGRIPAVRAAAPVAVFRYDGGSSFFALPNLECLSISRREGTDHGHATFRYNLASGLDGAPATMEEALGTGFAGELAVNPGDRLVVQALRPDGTPENLFDGFATRFGMDLDPGTEEVHVGALGVAWRCWDDVIPGAVMRDADNPFAVDDKETDLVAHFNPQGRPNRIPDDAPLAGTSGSGGDFRYPTFYDPLVYGVPGRVELQIQWTLPDAARYLIYRSNKDQKFVANPAGDVLDALLVGPDEGGGTPRDLTCPDLPVTGRDWPGTLHKLVGDCGFAMWFRLATDEAGLPRTSLVLARPQDGPVKHLYLAPRGTGFDPTLFNVGSSSLHREVGDVVNAWTVRGALARLEVSFVLAPGFPMSSSDASSASLNTFNRGHASYIAANRDKYRLYVLAETGEGYYEPGTDEEIEEATSIAGLFDENTEKNYVRRRRRALAELISRDAKGQPYPPRLAISTDYDGLTPGVWDGSGTWDQVTSSSWRVLQDRLGVEITDINPENWHVHDPGPWPVFPGGVVRGISSQAEAAVGKNFYLRLTCVIEADSALEQTAEPRGGSPLPQRIHRVVDASDRYRLESIARRSEFNPDLDSASRIVRDDRPRALAEAQAIRAGTEAGVLSGPVTIPRLTTYYRIGDRVASIEGRGLGLRTDQGTGDPVYPVVVGVSHHFDGGSQTTVLELSDAGTDRKRNMRPAGRAVRESRGGARAVRRRY